MPTTITAEQVLSSVLDALPTRMFWKDRQSRILGCNQAFADDAGVAGPADLIGKTHLEFYPRDHVEAFRADDAEVMESGRAKHAIEEELLLSSGRTIWVETNKMPLRDAEGTVIGVLGVYNDITERRHASDAREALID